MVEKNDVTSPHPQHRWDPILQEWVIYAPKRNKRPFQGKKFEVEKTHTWDCPFCPDAPEGAGNWVVKQLPNRFASLDECASPFLDIGSDSLYQTRSNYGQCEVILYSQDHHASFGTLTQSNIVALIELWQQRYRALAALPQMRFPFIMENRGKEVGNSMSHPHGQIYSFPYLPPKIQKKFDRFIQYRDSHGSCLLCDIIEKEIADPVRIIDQNADFIAEIPYYAHWAFEVHIIAKRHFPSLDEITPAEIENLAAIMKKVVNRYDALYGGHGGQDSLCNNGGQDLNPIMPYIMSMYNAPVNLEHRNKWHFHIEYYTPFRGPDMWKFLAGVELGTQTYINDALPEQNAQILRDLNL
ncbi:MAG: galactose-1-phosphate uridylyltransferase [Promethearchaeota archaeon]|nr:MAG: galactose-1-phosphate uridylyltransferase [Candidatus Lokiarchaeota archaeon]